AFMDDDKRILVFSEAGGTGRSYHAELSARNRRLRVHYLLEPGWKADAAIQGLGRTNRTNQAQPPLFRPIATDVKAEKRFLSTIARRLDTLGAITRGQRQTGGQGLFRPEDNLESHYGRDALRPESFVVTVRRTIYTLPGTGTETRLLRVTQRERNRPVTLDEALDRLSDPRAVLLINERSGRAAVQVPAPSLMLDDGEIE